MARCRFCNTSGLQWTSEDGRWVLHNPGSIQNRHNCPLARAFYSSRDDLVVRDTIERYLTAHPGGTTDPTIISSLARGIFIDGNVPQPVVTTVSIPAPNDSVFKYNSIYCGPWDNTRQYNKDDVVSFRDDLYVAALSHVNRIPSTFSGGTWQYVSKAHIISLLNSLTVENRDTKIIDTQQEFQRAIKL